MLSFRKALHPIISTAVFLAVVASPATGQSEKEAEAQATARDSDRDHVQEREEWFRSGRRALGENAAHLLHRAYTEKLRMREAREQAQRDAAKARRENSGALPEVFATPNFSNLVWQGMGPAPAIFDPTGQQSYGAVTGRVTSVVVDQSDATGNTVYVGAASGGVWKSINAASSDPGAVTWQPLIDDQPSLAVGSIALQPGTNLILVGTGETNSSGDSYYGMGILRSADGGHSWTLISDANNHVRSFRGLGFSNIAFSTANPSVVVAAAAATNGASPGSNGAETQGADGRGLYYSNDAGLTWSYAEVRDPSGIIQPASVGDVIFNSKQGKFYAAVRFHGYYSSVDGATWTRLTNQPGGITDTLCPGTPVSRSCPMYRGSLSVRENTGEIYTFFVDSGALTSTGGGIFVLSADGGTWSKLGQAGIDSCGQESGCGTLQGGYNLYIKAVPNGSNTDLYAGAINIFKCSSSAADPLCNATGAWKNLTHVYGCTPNAAPSGVHPDQHAIDFAKNSLPTRIFFGNDGGIYRALDSAGLSSGTCTGTNAFDNLNSQIGSFSEFVSFSQHPTDPGILLGGLQDNGSPSLVPGKAGALGTTWQGLNVGDGGYTAIDPNSPSTFYTSFDKISLQRCSSGASCSDGSWSSVINSTDVGGDGSAFYPPFILDPSLTTKILFGTCRVWRGDGTLGSSFTAISNNFSLNSASQCSGATSTGDTKVRSIASGGPVTGNGSQVIYAGMGGGDPIRGHVFVTTSADTGPASWNDRTANINPSGYEISDITVSPFDSTGRTAYLTIMGFGASHIFKTADAGVNWIDKNSNLPDSPANSITIDPINSNVLYVGTDVGVFVSIDDGASWADFGTGMPNVPVVKLKTFVSGGVKKLRAATYGRGMWQVDLASPDVNFSGSTLSFATILGRTSAAQQTTLANNTPGSITITSIAANGDFSATNNCPPILPSGSSCGVFINFSPHTAGIRAGSLVLTSNATGGNRTLPLSGNGVDFTLTLVRPLRPLRNVAASVARTGTRAQTAFFNVTVDPSTSDALLGLPESDRQVALQCTGVPQGMRCAVEPGKIDLANGSSPVKVSILADPKARAPRRLASKSATNATAAYNVQLRAVAGSIVRSVDLALTSK